MSTLQPIPRSRARTAYGLCNDVIKAVLAEPKRVNMHIVCSLSEQDYMPTMPACGTVGCFAGWVNVLAYGRSLARRSSTDLACRVLGPGRYMLPTTDQRVVYPKFHVFNSGSGDGINNYVVGTPEYAQAVVARIRKFMKMNEARLRARKLTPRLLARIQRRYFFQEA